MVWLYSLQASSPSYADATKLFRQITANSHQIVSSPLILGELLVLPRRNGDTFTGAAYKRLFSRSPIQMLSDISLISDTFSEIRANHRFASADALHLSLAAVANVDVFITEDQKLVNKFVSGIGSISTIQHALAQL